MISSRPAKEEYYAYLNYVLRALSLYRFRITRLRTFFKLCLSHWYYMSSLFKLYCHQSLMVTVSNRLVETVAGTDYGKGLSRIPRNLANGL